jgi:hypothetical protein
MRRELASVEEAVRRQQPIPADQVRDWMRSPYLEVNGAAFQLLFDHPQRLPALTDEERDRFFLAHLVRSIREDKPSTWVPGRYLAGHTLRAWFQRLWRDRDRNRGQLLVVRDALGELAREGGDLRDVVVTSVLEHLFQDPEIAEFFAPWAQQDARLRSAYDEGLLLSGE